MHTCKQFIPTREACLRAIYVYKGSMPTPMVDISTRYTHLSRAGISRRHLCRHASLLGVHLSLACISLENASYLYFTGVYLVRFHRLCISGLYISQGARKVMGRVRL